MEVADAAVVTKVGVAGKTVCERLQGSSEPSQGGALPPYVAQYGPGPDGINGYDYGGQAPQYAGQYGYIWQETDRCL